MAKDHIILDADPLVYQIGYKVMRNVTVESADGVDNVHSVFSKADVIAAMDRAIGGLFEKLGTDKITVTLSDPAGCWRSGILPSYKQNRTKTGRPGAYGTVRAEFMSRWPVLCFANMEADDICGMLMTEKSKAASRRILVSIDKDLKTIPCRLYNPDKDIHQTVSLAEADYWHMFQTLTGDVVDNYKGVPKCGPKKAIKLLGLPEPGAESPIPRLWPIVLQAYADADLTPADALVQAQMAGILRHGQYNRRTEKITPWQPPRTQSISPSSSAPVSS